MATIFDVAKAAHVSKSTVSRVVNRDPAVKPETRRAVEAAIRELNYSPSYFAKGIRTGQTKTIALLVPEYTNMFYGEMFNGVEDVAILEDYVVIVCNTGNAVSEKEYIQKLLDRNIDGIIYNTYRVNPEITGYLQQLGEKMPVVFMDEALGKSSICSSVYTDGFEATRRAVHFLIETGCRQIGYIQNEDSINATEYRFQGYRQGLKDCGIHFAEQYLYRCPKRSETNYIKSGMEAANYFLKLAKRPDAIMAAIDLLAIGCVNQLKRQQIDIPGQISVVGFDNIELGEVSEPSLTTIAQPTREMGRLAAEIVIRQLKEQQPSCQRKVFDAQLIIRETTKQEKI